MNKQSPLTPWQIENFYRLGDLRYKKRNRKICPVCGGEVSYNPKGDYIHCFTSAGICNGEVKKILSEGDPDKFKKSSPIPTKQSKVDFTNNTAENLNIFYRSLFRNPNNQLSKDDIKALKSRGFDDKSIKGFVAIKKGYNYVSANIPALSFIKIDNKYSHGEKYFYSSHSGILFLTKDTNGNYIGGQIWNYNKEKKEDPKYFPIANSHVYFPDIKEKESPLYVFIPEVYNSNFTNSFLLTEGILKSHLASILHDLPVIGASGGNFKASKHQLKVAIEKYKFTSAIVAIDAGDPTNPQRIKHWKNQFKMFKSLGLHVAILWYEQYQKDERGDIDEINLSEINYQLISENEFFEHCKNYKQLGKRQWKKSKELSPDIVIDKQFFSIDKDDLKGLENEIKSSFDNELMIKQNKILAIKSPLGSGKTRFLIDSIIKILNDRNEKALCPSSRRALNAQTQNKINQTIDAVNDLNYQENYFYILNDFKSLPVDQDGTLLNLMLCIDSFQKLESHLDDITNMTIIIDEIISVLYHLIFSNTLKKERFEIIRLFKTILSNCKRIIILDGNLTDWAVKFISDISKKDSITIENIYKKAQKAIINVLQFEVTKDGEIRKKYRTSIIEKIFNAIEDGKKIAITVDSINEGLALERDIKNRFPDSKIININARTKGDENKFIERYDETIGKTVLLNEVDLFCIDPDSYIEKNQIDVLIYNSTIESGVDISIDDYFSDQFIIISGVLIIDSVLQIIKRIRDDKVTRWLWVNERGLFGNNNYASFLEDQTKKNVGFLHSIRAKKLEKMIEELQYNSNLSHEQKELLALESFKEMIAPTFESEIDNLRNKFLSMLKFESIYFKECLIERLSIDYEINLYYSEINEGIKKSQKLIREQLKDERAELILKSDYIPDDYDKSKLENLECPDQRLNPTPQKPDVVGIENFYLRQQLSEITLTKELIKKVKQDRQLIGKIDNYFLFNNPEIFNIFMAKDLIMSAKNKKAVSDLKLNFDFIELMHRANFKAIIELTTYHNDSPEIINFVDNLLNNKSLVRELNKYDSLAIKSLKGKDRAKGIGCLLARLGYTTKAKKITLNGERVNVYEILSPDQDEIRNLILQGRSNFFNSQEGGLMDFILRILKIDSPQSLTQQGLEGVHTPKIIKDNNIKKEGCGHPQSLIYQEVKPPQKEKIENNPAPPCHPALGKEVILHGKKWTIHQIKDDMAYLINLIGDSLTYGLKALIMLNPEIIA